MNQSCVDALDIVNSVPRSVVLSFDNQTVLFSFSNLKGRNPRPFKLARFIPINSLLFECMGLWFGDGTKGNIGLVNNEFCLLKEFRKFFCEIGVGDSAVRARIALSSCKLPFRSELESWVFNELGVAKANITVGVFEREKPILSILVCSVAFSKFFSALHEFLKPLILNDARFTASYLRGLFAAEGCVAIRNGRVNKLCITQKKNHDWISKLLSKLGMRFHIRELDFLMTGRDVFEIFAKYDLAGLHPLKKEKFWRGFNAAQIHFENGEPDRLILEELVTGSTVRQLSKKLGRNRQTMREHLRLKENSLMKRGFAEICGSTSAPRGPKASFWKITSTGLEFVSKQRQAAADSSMQEER